MKYYLITFDDNYADEFDISGFFAASEEEWLGFKSNKLPKWISENNIELYFGTNESISYSSLKEYFSSFSQQEITKEQYDALVSLFNVGVTKYDEDDGPYWHVNAYGTFPNPFET